MALPTSLSSLSPREAVADAMYRALLGLDTGDSAMFDASMTNDAVADMGMGGVMEGVEAINEGIFKRVGPMMTHHNISNVRVDVEDGADTASMSAYAIAQHKRPEEGLDPKAPHLTSGAIYYVDAVKHESEGVWKVKKWVMRLLWLDGDWAVMGR